MDNKKIQRMNELTLKLTDKGLSEDEKIEYKTLKDEFNKALKKNLKSVLDSVPLDD
jgi:uncharacterized protein YnzC (UPF0291/DUF896 family)